MKPFRFVSPFLLKLTGEDYTIINKCDEKIKYHFTLIGLMVLFILFFSFVSALYFTEHLFSNLLFDVVVGVLWGYIVTNMYVLVLYTISPPLLPVKIKSNRLVKSRKFIFSFSMALRIFIVCLLAIIIAQPLNILILKPNTIQFVHDIKFLLNNNPLSWVINFLAIGIFIYPIYLKYTVRNLGMFYLKKETIEKKIVEDDYVKFKEDYRSTFKIKINEYNQNLKNKLFPFLEKLNSINDKYRLEQRKSLYEKIRNELIKELNEPPIEKYEYWADPPYRTIPKSKSKNILLEKDLLKQIYN